MTAPLELGIVIPAFNERENVRPMLAALAQALAGISYEVIYVDDDSPDGTALLVREIALSTPNVRVLQRIGRRGLSSACIEGMMATSAPVIAVIDGDMQHDERILPDMLRRLRTDNLDLVVATRNSGEGSMGDFSTGRVRLSDLGRTISSFVTHLDLSDPMSGFFMVDRRFLDTVVRSASGVGFKILVDLVSSAKRPVRYAEVPYTFRLRLHGESKLDLLVLVEYLHLILDKTIGNLVPPRFITFSLVGLSGLVLFVGVDGILVNDFGWGFLSAQAMTAVMSMTLNFFLNNVFTYRDRRLRGGRLISGLLLFYVACSLGGLLNLEVASWARAAGMQSKFAAAIGLVVGAFWNYGVGAMITWRSTRRRTQASVS